MIHYTMHNTHIHMTTHFSMEKRVYVTIETNEWKNLCA